MDAAYRPTTYLGTTYAVATKSDDHDAFPPYLVGRLRSTSTQKKSCRGREGFAIAAEHLETKHDGVIFNHSGFLFRLRTDVSVYYLLLCLPAKHDEGGAGAEAAAEPDESRLSLLFRVIFFFF